MSVYKIVPLTKSFDNFYDSRIGISADECKKMCSKDNNCLSFLYSYSSDKKGEATCSLMNHIPNTTSYGQSSTLFVKNGSPSYWVLWLFLALLLLIVFTSKCKKLY